MCALFFQAIGPGPKFFGPPTYTPKRFDLQRPNLVTVAQVAYERVSMESAMSPPQGGGPRRPPKSNFLGPPT